MNTIEEQLRQEFLAEERRAPAADQALVGIHRAITRRRRLRAGAATAVAVAAVVTGMATLPVTQHSRPSATLHSRPLPAAQPPRLTKPGLTVASTLAPTWLPAGFVETERAGEQGAYAGRIFNRSGALIWVTDEAKPRDLGGARTETVRVAGHTGQGFWLNPQHVGYRIQARWSPGHWLWLTVRGTGSDRTDALRIANSIVQRLVPISVPVRCPSRYCADLTQLDVTGSPRRWTAAATSPAITIVATGGRPLTSANGTINGRRALIHSGSVSIDFGHDVVVSLRTTTLTRTQLLAAARTVSLTPDPAYPWLGH